MLLIILILTIVVIFLFFFRLYKNRQLKRVFTKHNVIVYGAKGSGKDLIFQKVINMKKTEPYLSNQDYGFRYNVVRVADLTVAPNTYENFIDNAVKQIQKEIKHEDIDVYLSDLGIYLPSQYDNILSKKFPSFPIYYALSRQLYNQNIHCNTQALGRLWIKIREQADFYIKTIETKQNLFDKIFRRLRIKCRYYDKYESALNDLLPMTKKVNKEQRALAEQYYSTHGVILNRDILIKLKDIHYNTRHFEEEVFLNVLKRRKSRK